MGTHMLPKLSIAAKLYIIFTLLAVATIALAGIAVTNARHQAEMTSAYETSLSGTQNVERVNGLIYAVVMESRGIYMSSDIPTARRYGDLLLKFNDRIAKVVEEWHKRVHPEDVAQFEEFSKRIGEIVTGTAQRYEGGSLVVTIDRAEAFMPRSEQIPGEQLHPGRPVLVVILEPEHNRRQAQVRVSRASRAFVHRLMEAEVPEIKAGTVQVRAIAREPGLRTKIAVSSSEPGLDPVGACVGPKGVRHRAILSELGLTQVVMRLHN